MCFVVLFMNFGLLNIVVGVFVENSISEAAADAEHVPTSGASGPVRVCIHQPLWKFVGRARDPCRSTVRVSTRTRVTYSLCNVYK